MNAKILGSFRIAHSVAKSHYRRIYTKHAGTSLIFHLSLLLSTMYKMQKTFTDFVRTLRSRSVNRSIFRALLRFVKLLLIVYIVFLSKHYVLNICERNMKTQYLQDKAVPRKYFVHSRCCIYLQKSTSELLFNSQRKLAIRRNEYCFTLLGKLLLNCACYSIPL